MKTNKLRYSFAPGIEKLAVKDEKMVREQIFSSLGLKTSSEYCRKKQGMLDIRKSDYDAITSIFERFGVAEKDVWRIY